MSNLRRTLVEAGILLAFAAVYLGLHGGYRALFELSPTTMAILAGLFLWAALRQIIPILRRRRRRQPEPPPALSETAWRLIVVAQLVCCLLMLVFDGVWVLPLMLIPLPVLLRGVRPSPGDRE